MTDQPVVGRIEFISAPHAANEADILRKQLEIAVGALYEILNRNRFNADKDIECSTMALQKIERMK